MLLYDTEISHKEEYDHVIINDELDICVSKIQNLILEKRKYLRDRG